MAEQEHRPRPHQDPEPVSAAVTQQDPAAKSLAEALRVSFRLLTGIMILMILLFLGTGFKGIKSNEVGIVKRFGRVVSTARAGLTWNWPFPIGEIEVVKTDQENLLIEDFWWNETPQDIGKGGGPSGGLRPGWDGAFLTGDRFLLHMKIACTYQVSDPVAYRLNVAEPHAARYPNAPKGEVIDPKEETIRSAVCDAAIRAAAVRTADGLQRGQRQSFAEEVEAQANQALEKMRTGLVIINVTLPKADWPAKARDAYEAAQKAVNLADKRRSAARSTAQDLLGKVAGEAYVQLVGEPWRIEAGDEENQGGLIGRYERLREQAARTSDPQRKAQRLAEAEKVLGEIDDLLEHGARGDAARTISLARAHETQVKQRIQGRYDEFARLLPKYLKSPRFTIERLWAETREEVLSSVQEKFLIPAGGGATVLMIDRDPKIVRAQRQEELKADREKRQEAERRRRQGY